MQLAVAFPVDSFATLGSVKTILARNYWAEVVAPKLRTKKQELGRSPTNTEIASFVERESGYNTSRQLVEHWFRGIREPYVGQYLALCNRMEMDPVRTMEQTTGSAARAPMRGTIRVSPSAKAHKKSQDRTG